MITYTGKQIREKQGLTVRGLARKAGLSSGAVSTWETGKHLPDLETLDLAAVALGVKPWQLIEFDGLSTR